MPSEEVPLVISNVLTLWSSHNRPDIYLSMPRMKILIFGFLVPMHHMEERLSIPPIALPPDQPVSTVLPKKICKIMTFNISLGTANVRTFYRGDEGHPGKLQYVREQFQAHGLHFLGLQETRCAQGTSFQNHIYRIVSGHQGGHLGVDMIG